jgi:hypothetical protein
VNRIVPGQFDLRPNQAPGVDRLLYRAQEVWRREAGITSASLDPPLNGPLPERRPAKSAPVPNVEPALETEVDVGMYTRMYPFTRGMRLTNDGVAYGEIIALKVITRTKCRQMRALRTRTGMIVEPGRLVR